VLKLIIEDDEGRKTVVPFVRDEITIGRQEGNTIRLTERNVSRRHARLMKSSAAVLIEDLGSYNGIRINGDRIAGQVKVNDGDLIQIGDYDLAIQAEEVAATMPLETARAIAPTGRMPAAVMPENDASATMPALPTVEMPAAADEDVQPVGSDEPPEIPRHQSTAVIRVDQVEGSTRKRSQQTIDAAEAPRLVVLNTDFAGREFPCTRTEMKIGRTDDNDVALDHRSLSRTHCKVVREDNGEWRVIDLQSANGLMVNGEPYAQVTLRFGDTIELGHVKLQFVGPGESPSLPATTSSITQETAPAGSKAPLFAIIGAVAVIILGGGGYALWKSRSPVEPHKDPQVVVRDPVKPPPVDVKDPDPVKQADPVPDEPRVNPEATRKAIAQKISDAKLAIAALDWGKATELLRDCKLDNSIAPEAQQLLTQLDAEKGFRNALDEAGRLLDAGNDDKARTLLESARNTRLLSKKYAELEARRAKLVADKLDKQKPPQVVPPPHVDPPKGKTEEAEALFREGQDLTKQKQFDSAVIRLERCIKIAPMYFNCYKQLGSVHAKIANRDNSSSDLEKARKYYERFLELAPPDDESVAKVRDILEQAKKPQ
jgi:pSer/pThr/pTyr-binding forkhead associated (FHA) protein